MENSTNTDDATRQLAARIGTILEANATTVAAALSRGEIVVVASQPVKSSLAGSALRMLGWDGTAGAFTMNVNGRNRLIKGARAQGDLTTEAWARRRDGRGRIFYVEGATGGTLLLNVTPEADGASIGIAIEPSTVDAARRN